MGLLDLPAPAFAWLDRLLSGVAPPTLRLAFWGLLGAAISMGVYWLVSPQRRIAAAKADAAAARRRLDAYDGDFEGAWPLIRHVLGSAFGQLGLVTWPAVAGSLPVLALLVWLSTAYGHAFPANDAEIAISTVPQTLQARLEPGADPASGQPAPRIVVVDDGGQVVEQVPLPAPVPIIHKRQWWNALIGNPIGYLPDHGPLERIELAIPQQEYLPIGPEWLRAWYVVFFGSLLCASVAIKVAARIE
jgi:hypothetical protein